MSAGGVRDLLDDLLGSREENRHFDDAVGVTLSFRDETLTVRRGC